MPKKVNDEAQMTNDEGMTKRECRNKTGGLMEHFRHSSFRFHSSFVIRHSSFSS